jgi:hemerythrin-like metal-binding protein
MIGEATTDADHQEWFRLAHVFLVACEQRTRQDAGEAFSSFTRHHFFKEETLMREIRYPFLATHQNEHERLFGTLEKIFNVDVDEVLSKTELEEFVAFTLAKHITGFDAQLSVYVRRNCHAPVM